MSPELLKTLTDPIFIVAAIAALAAVASAFISWRVWQAQTKQAREMLVVSVEIERAKGFWLLTFNVLNLSPYRWKWHGVEILRPRGAGLYSPDRARMEGDGWNLKAKQVDPLQLSARCDLATTLEATGSEREFLDRVSRTDSHWERFHLYCDPAHETALSMRLTFESMEARPRSKVITIKRTLSAVPQVAT